ncbi:MAG: hypothetical protein HXY47_03600, partial [Nitrospirae bacterium]|nr:hypothetical protein [Nitrospirota bacterium]
MPYWKGRIANSIVLRANSNPSLPPLSKGRSKEGLKSKEHGTERIKFYALCSLLFAICSVLFVVAVDAKVKGRCKDCHSMHAEKPFPVLTKGGCIGCHGQRPEGTQNIITIGKARIPQVLHHMENGDLAGGNFYYVADGYNPDYTKGHNVTGISQPESIPTM